MTPHEKRGFMPNKLQTFEADLDSLLDLMQNANGPLTVMQIKRICECSKQAVYFRLNALAEKRGVKFRTTKVREGEHGPFSKAYSLLK